MRNKNYIIEFLRFFFTIGVVVGHTFCVFYQKNNPTYQVWFHNACVDFFFVISGYFMARHFSVEKSENVYKAYVNYNFSRIKRLWPLLFIAGLEGFIFDFLQNYFLYNRIGFESRKIWTLFFLGGLNKFMAWNVIWYISALFWSGLLVSALLCFRRKISIVVIFPFIMFFSLSYMNIYGNSNLGGIPLIHDWLSAGLFRAVCGLIFGVEAYFLARYVETVIEFYARNFIRFASISVEILFILLIMYLALKQQVNNAEFLMYFFTSAILIVFDLQLQFIFRIFDFKCWAFFGKISAIIYVTHYYLLKVLYFSKSFRMLPQIVVYSICVLLSVGVGIVVYLLYKQISAFISKRIFVHSN